MNEELLQKVKNKVESLQKLGGFRILAGVVDGKKGIRDLNPNDEPRRNAFLTDEDKAPKRASLKAELEMLKELIQEGTADEIVESCKTKSEKSLDTLNENLSTALKQNRDLETSYRSMELFFRNAEEEGMRNLYFVNMPKDEFISPNSTYLNDVRNHFRQQFNRFSLDNNYSYFVVPGYLGERLESFSKVAKEHRIMLITDFQDAKDYEDIENEVETLKLAGDEPHKSNTIVTCNYGVVRRKYDGIEDEDLYAPMSLAIAGKLYNSSGMQPPAGKRHGKLDGVLGTRLDLMRDHVDEIDGMGMIPVIHENAWGTVAMGNATLSIESSDPDVRALEVVKAKDWIAKVLLDYFNSLTFSVYTGDLREEIKRELNKFFNKIKGAGRLLEAYTIEGPVKDPDNPQAIKIAINVKPFFAAKHYIIDFTGTQGNFKEGDGE